MTVLILHLNSILSPSPTSIEKRFAKEFLSYFPEGGAYPVPQMKDFFELNESVKKESDSSRIDSIIIDAHLTSAERAASTTVLIPGYKVVNPLPYHINNALVFPIAKDNVWRRYIDKWIDFRKQDGTFDKIYDQWILGHPYQKKEWSCVRKYFKTYISSKKQCSEG